MLAWMDIEMTGLDPARHVIVEIASLRTDDELRVIAEGPDIVAQATATQLAAMDGVVMGMHLASGLLDRIRSSTVSLAAAGAVSSTRPDPVHRDPCAGEDGLRRETVPCAWVFLPRVIAPHSHLVSGA